MIRAVLDEALLLLLPFAVFALVLLVGRRNVLDRAQWRGRWPWLVMAGLGLVIVSALVSAFFVDQNTGPYVPPHLENGQVVPGHFR